MRPSLAFFTQHTHVMVESSTLVQIVLRLGFPDEYKVINGIEFSEKNLRVLVELISAKHVLVEETPYAFMYLSEYFERILDEDCQSHLIDISREILRANDQIFHYDHSIELAKRLKPYFKDCGLNFRDCLDLAVASMSNAKFYISKKKQAITSCISSLHEDVIDFGSLQIHDIDSFVDYVENDTTHLDVLASQDLIQVYTREGKCIAIQRESTPVDFAYKIHTALGNSCHQARITRHYGQGDAHSFNCKLNFVLEDGDKVEIIKRPDGLERPDKAWCKFVETDKAYDAICSFWNKESVRRGNSILKEAFGDSYFNGKKFQFIAHRLSCGSIEVLQQKLGTGEITIKAVHEKVTQYAKFMQSKSKVSNFKLFEESENKEAHSAIIGWDSTCCVVARCCYPMPTDTDNLIHGVISKRATFLHRSSCTNITHLGSDRKRKLAWNTDKCTAVLKIRLKDRDDIVRCLLNKMVEHRVEVNLLNLSSAPSLYPTSERTSNANICVLFDSMLRLKTLIEDIEDIPDVVQVSMRQIFPGDTAYKNPADNLRQ